MLFVKLFYGVVVQFVISEENFMTLITSRLYVFESFDRTKIPGPVTAVVCFDAFCGNFQYGVEVRIKTTTKRTSINKRRI